MVNQTPLRLIAIGERPPAEDDGSDPDTMITDHDLVAIEEGHSAEDAGSANPVTMMTEHDAITRRVPDSANLAARQGFSGQAEAIPQVADSAAYGCGRRRERERGDYRCSGDQGKEHSSTGQRHRYTGPRRKGALPTAAVVGSASAGCGFTFSDPSCPGYHPHRNHG